MKTFPAFLCCACFAASVFGQAPVAQMVDPPVSQSQLEAQPASQTPAQPGAQDGNQPATQPFTADELNQLLGPIALYPDPLIGLILPASTVPSDIVVADRYMEQGGDPAQVPNQAWDDSVKGLTHYPDLLKWLDQNLAWTTQLGQAYLAQPADVMTSIQQLRARARADGTLMNSDQQQVGMDQSGNVTITPTNDDTLYVPQYDTNAVYDNDYTLDDRPVIGYDDGWPVGPWLCYWPNWNQRGIYFGDWHRWLNFHNGGAGFAGDPAASPWVPNTSRIRASYQFPTANMQRPAIARARPLAASRIVHTAQAAPGVTQAALVSAPQGESTWRGTITIAPRRALARPSAAAPPVQVQQGDVVSGGYYGRGGEGRVVSGGQGGGQVTYGGYGAYGGQAPVQASYGGYTGYGRTVAPAAAPRMGGGVGVTTSAGASSGGERGGGQGRYGR